RFLCHNNAQRSQKQNGDSAATQANSGVVCGDEIRIASDAKTIKLLNFLSLMGHTVYRKWAVTRVCRRTRRNPLVTSTYRYDPLGLGRRPSQMTLMGGLVNGW
ncbi:hypothetical protein C0J52_28321, partial [Blattella germanica]